jgi:hypothetical protein
MGAVSDVVATFSTGSDNEADGEADEAGDESDDHAGPTHANDAPADENRRAG